MSELRLSDVKNELKKIGCKLKSQLDGSFAICEPKGTRTIVPTLEAAMEYYRSKVEPTVTVPVKSQAPVADVVQLPTASLQSEPVDPVQTDKPQSAGSAKKIVSVEQQQAIASVNNMLNEIREQRLPRGLNFLHSEIKQYLLKNGCPPQLVDKAYIYAEARLHKDCIDKKLIRCAFRNHLSENDVMYFSSQYAYLFAAAKKSEIA